MLDILKKVTKHNTPIIADGAMGTMLIKYGLSTGQSPEEVNISKPNILEKIHSEYKKAGATILQTNTFGANRLKLESYGLENQIQKIISEGVKIAKNTAADDALVGLSVGPTGKLMKPYGTHSFEELYEVFKEQIGHGVEAGVDMICIETMGDMGELKAAYLAAKQFHLPVSCAVSFENNGRTLMGTGAETYVKTMTNWGSDVIGANCISPESLWQLLGLITDNCSNPIYIRSNAGEPVLKDNQTIYPMGPKDFADYGVKFLEKGAVILGGCCGTMPDHISALKESLKDKEIKISRTIDSKKWLTSAVNSIPFADGLNSYILKVKDYIQDNSISIQKVAGDLREKEGKVQIFILDFSDECPNNIQECVEFIQTIVRTPLVFQGASIEALESALKPYKGVAGVNPLGLDGNELLRVIEKYGGEII